MTFAENYAFPVTGELYAESRKKNDLGESFPLRYGKIHFQVHSGSGNGSNLKVILKVYRDIGICELYIVDTDSYASGPDESKRVTRCFAFLPFSQSGGKVHCIKFSYIFHLDEQSIPSKWEYIFMDRPHLEQRTNLWRTITGDWITKNDYCTTELDAALLQRDVDWYNHHFDSLGMIPKFTRGNTHHPYHPKRYIHDRIDEVVEKKLRQPECSRSIKICVDCIDDTDFVNHLLFASSCGVEIRCIVDWRKMTLTSSCNYIQLKKSEIELLGVFCSSDHPLVEVAPDMHTKFIIFDDEHALIGSFNITFDRWGTNWETGATFHSAGICRILDNIFQSIRGGVIQQYGVDPYSHFNLLYTFGRQKQLNGYNFRPHHAIISRIHNARKSIRACLFLLGEMQGEYGDSVVDALIAAKQRGVDIVFIFNGHVARVGDITQEVTMDEELRKPLLPAIERLRMAGISIGLAYGNNNHAVPYSPLHAKYCIIDDHIVLDGSFNWYNTSVFSHDHLTVTVSNRIAMPFIHEFHEIINCLRIFWA